jgi:hypothetical protein
MDVGRGWDQATEAEGSSVHTFGLLGKARTYLGFPRRAQGVFFHIYAERDSQPSNAHNITRGLHVYSAGRAMAVYGYTSAPEAANVERDTGLDGRDGRAPGGHACSSTEAEIMWASPLGNHTGATAHASHEAQTMAALTAARRCGAIRLFPRSSKTDNPASACRLCREVADIVESRVAGAKHHAASDRLPIILSEN